MFNSRDIDPFMREKEHAARSQPLRGFAHRRAPPERTHSDGLFTSRIPGGIFGRSFSGHDSYGGGDFAESWRSMSPSNGRDSGHATPTSAQQRSGAYQDQRRMTFEQAVTNMISALTYANEGLQKLETTFSKDVSSMKLWLPTQHIDSLWIIYTAWNGIPATKAKNPTSLKADGSETTWSAVPTPTYADITTRISKALTGLRHCSPPNDFALGIGNRDDGVWPQLASSTNSGVGGLGWHLLRTTMRKLEISFEAVEELITLVRTHRDQMPALRHEVQAALQLLESMRPMLKSDSGKGKATARETGTGTERRRNIDEEYDWPQYGSI